MVTVRSEGTSIESMAARLADTRLDHHAAEPSLTLDAPLLYDPDTKSFLRDRTITISRSTGLITSIKPSQSFPHPPPHTSNLDLTGLTILPGLVDAHTHIFLHSYREATSITQERDESPIERTLRASNHLRLALKAGYTTYRDLGTEGVFDADTHVRNAVNRGIIPGPRLFVTTEPLASSGSYEVRYESGGVLGGTRVPRIADSCDGVDGVRAGVRRRIAAGADVIKFYGDYRRRTLRFPAPNGPGQPDVMFPPGNAVDSSFYDRNPVSTMWTQDEINAMVEEAKRARCPVAAHCILPETAVMAAEAKVTTIEHQFLSSDESLEAMKDNGVIFVPTLAVIEAEAGDQPKLWKEALEHTHKAWKMGVKLATGGDTGAFPHGENVREVELFVKAGVTIEDALWSATVGGWEACGGDWSGRRFGRVKEGWTGDFIAVEGDPREDLGALRRVRHVIKDGRVVVRDGRVVEPADL